MGMPNLFVSDKTSNVNCFSLITALALILQSTGVFSGHAHTHGRGGEIGLFAGDSSGTEIDGAKLAISAGNIPYHLPAFASFDFLQPNPPSLLSIFITGESHGRNSAGGSVEVSFCLLSVDTTQLSLVHFSCFVTATTVEPPVLLRRPVRGAILRGRL